MSAPITPVPGREYVISGSATFEHEGRTQNAVYFTTDSIAYAGRLMTDPKGEYVAVAFDSDDAMIEAHPDWAALIIREIPATLPAAAQAA